MNPHLCTALLFSALLATGLVHSEVYKSINEDGNIVYSDTPTEGAEQITPPAISTIDTPKALKTVETAVDAESADETTKSPTEYTTFSIQQPQDQMTIWDNSGNISVSMQLEPELDVASGHRIWVYVDGEPMVKDGVHNVQPLSGINRGTHKIRAAIRSGNQTIESTRTITIYMKQASKLN